MKIYRAEGLPPMNTDIITSIKQAFVGDSAPMCDPYVEVSFGGHTVSTGFVYIITSLKLLNCILTLAL